MEPKLKNQWDLKLVVNEKMSYFVRNISYVSDKMTLNFYKI